MSLGIAIDSLPNASDVSLINSDDPFLMEVLAPIESETAEFAASLAIAAAQGLVDALRDQLVSGAPTDFDTFAEALQRALADAAADEQAISALSGLLAALSNGFSAHTGNLSNPHGVTKAQVGLANAENTADLDKVISTATQLALNGKVTITRQVNGGGLATGGGGLNADRTITVTKASNAEGIEGTSATVVVTPDVLRAVLADLFSTPGRLSGLLPSTLPAQPGVPWLNGGVVSIS